MVKQLCHSRCPIRFQLPLKSRKTDSFVTFDRTHNRIRSPRLAALVRRIKSAEQIRNFGMPRHPMRDALAPKTIRYPRGLNDTLCRLDTCEWKSKNRTIHSSQHSVLAVRVLDFPLMSRGFFASTREPQLHMRPLPRCTQKTPWTFDHRRAGCQNATFDVRPLQSRRSKSILDIRPFQGRFPSRSTMRPWTFDHVIFSNKSALYVGILRA